MAVDFKTSETMKNLMKAFAGESQARNRYTFAAGQAKKENLYVISAIFKFTAKQEKEHAEIFYNHLKEMAGENISINGTYPVDITESVIQLLRYAEHNEMEEYGDVYKHFSEVASSEGFAKISADFKMIADIEKILDEVIFIENGEIILHDSVAALREKEKCSIDEFFRRKFYVR